MTDIKAQPDRLVTSNNEHFDAEVAARTALRIVTPHDFLRLCGLPPERWAEHHQLLDILRNALNNTNLNAPVVNFLDPNFGRILSAQEPRDIQVGIKFLTLRDRSDYSLIQSVNGFMSRTTQ